MLVTTFISIFAIFLAHLSQFKSKGKLFEIGFVMLTITASIQYGYGTDYFTYYDLWERYSSYDVKTFIEEFFDQKDWIEPGWVLLNALFGFRNGFFIIIAIVSVVENFIYYRLIKEYVPIKWRWFAVFLYVGMDCLYLLNFSMLRQGFVVSLFVAEVMLMNKRKLIPAVALMIFSLSIHMVSAVCIPFIVLYFMPLKNTKTIAALLLVLTIFIFVFKDIVVGLLNIVLAVEEFGKYSNYGQKTLTGIGIGYILIHIPNIVILYALSSNRYIKTREQKVIALLAFCDMLITPLQFYGADLAGRLGIFFIAFKVVSIPVIYSAIKERTIRISLLYLMVFSTLLMYYQFFQNYTKGYGEGYKTIFSVI